MLDYPKHLLDFSAWSKNQIISLFDTALKMEDILKTPIKKSKLLEGRTIATVFFEDSTRTKISFELASKRLSADVVSFSANGSSIAKGESYKDTIITLDAMGVDAFVIRVGSFGVCNQATEWVDKPIINAGEGWRAHPTQALLDAYTMIKKFDSLADKKIAIVGDIMHSRVARSNAELLPMLGAKVWLCGPQTLLPQQVNDLVNITDDIDEALKDADVIMALRIQKERMETGLLPSIHEYVSKYQINDFRLKIAKSDAYIMHPGPMNRDVEIDGDLADGPKSLIKEQVKNGQPIRMSVLYHLLKP